MSNAAPGVESSHWYVDDRCLNCNIARQYAPGLIGYQPSGDYGGSSTVLRQPANEEETRQLYMAAHACPTRSVHPPANEWAPDSDPYPMALDEDGIVLRHPRPQVRRRFRRPAVDPRGDLRSRPDADSVIRGQDPIEIGPGVMAHPFPGHTKCSTLFIADKKFCFSGDAVFSSRSEQDLEVPDSVVYDSIKTLAESVARGAEELTFE
ncbi:ferredoxin [Streptomyces sp. FXJ1.4098]|nr:ferredoxin [Streptomyces sp. FXJ1.4098]